MRSVAFSSDGEMVLAARSGSGGINTWSLSSGELTTAKLAGIPMAEAPRMYWSPDGKFLLSRSWRESGEIRVWDSATGALVKLFTGHTAPPTHLDVSRDGRRVLSCAGDYSVRVWDMETTEELLCVDNLDSAAHCAAFSPDGAQFVTGGEDGGVAVYDATTGDELARHAGHSGRINDVVWSSTGSRIATAGEDGTVRLWRPATPAAP
jgi:WD40 repeat protein